MLRDDLLYDFLRLLGFFLFFRYLNDLGRRAGDTLLCRDLVFFVGRCYELSHKRKHS